MLVCRNSFRYGLTTGQPIVTRGLSSPHSRFRHAMGAYSEPGRRISWRTRRSVPGRVAEFRDVWSRPLPWGRKVTISGSASITLPAFMWSCHESANGWYGHPRLIDALLGELVQKYRASRACRQDRHGYRSSGLEYEGCAKSSCRASNRSGRVTRRSLQQKG
jgi:hypothetical protein